jgi:nucleoside transporter
MAATEGAPLNYATPVGGPPPLKLDVRLRLSVMMLLQFGVWGAWFTVLGNYLKGGRGFSDLQVGSIYGTIPLGAIIAMMFAGQLADRVLASEKLMAIFHLAGAVLLYVLAKQTTFAGVWWTAFAWALVYNPTLAISNSLAFANIPDATRDFPSLRVLGTIGWIIAASSPDWFLKAGAISTNQPLLIGAGISAALGLLSLALPHTPPAGKGGGAFPFLRAFGLLRDPSFAIFFGLTLVITIALAFYYTWTGVFLEKGAGVKNVPSTMAIGQWSEIGFMLLLPFALRGLGMKFVLAIGMAAWAVRYGMFATASHGTPFVLVLIGVALHGVCFDFFLAAGFIHTENKAPAAIRGSAQALFSLIVYGVGMFIGSIVSANVVAAYTGSDGVAQWSKIWVVPAIGAAACLLLFLVLWRDRPGKLEEEVAEARGFPVEPVSITPATVESTSNG